MSYRREKVGVTRLADGAHITRGRPGWDEYQTWVEAGGVPEAPVPVTPPAPSAAEIIAALTAAIQQHLNAAARAKNYDNIHTAALRAAFAGPYQAEGLAYAQWMDACWAHGYQVLADAQAALRPVPTAAELIAELPTLELPS